MQPHRITAVLLLPSLAACASTAPPSSSPGGVIAPATQAGGTLTANTKAPDSGTLVLNGTSTVRGGSVPVVNGSFTAALPTGAAVDAIAEPITARQFGLSNCGANTDQIGNPNARVVRVSYFDLVQNGAVVGYAAAGTANGGTVTGHTWLYSTAATTVTSSKTCTDARGVLNRDTVDLRLVPGWNSTTITVVTNPDGSKTSTYFTTPLGAVTWQVYDLPSATPLRVGSR